MVEPYHSEKYEKKSIEMMKFPTARKIIQMFHTKQIRDSRMEEIVKHVKQNVLNDIYTYIHIYIYIPSDGKRKIRA